MNDTDDTDPEKMTSNGLPFLFMDGNCKAINQRLQLVIRNLLKLEHLPLKRTLGDEEAMSYIEAHP